MGLFDNLFKTAEQREQEYKNYYEWAYPFGDTHKDKVADLIHGFVKDEDEKFSVYNYLVTRQHLAPSVYKGKYAISDDEFKSAVKKLKKNLISKGKKSMEKYMALVEADLMIDDNYNYPSLEELDKRAQEIKAIISK